MAFFEALGGAAAIQGLTGAAGGVLSNLINQNQQENEATRNQSNFDTQLDSTIQRRVADAKKAGLHPLYALGVSSAPSSQPITIQDSIGPSLNQAGQNIGNILGRQGSAADRLKTVLENKLLDSQIGETDARKNLIQAQQAQMNQANQTDLGIRPELQNKIIPEGQAPNPPGTDAVGYVEKKPAALTSQMQGREDLIAGRSRGGFELRTMGHNFPMIMPVAEGESPMELWSEMSLYDKAGLINRNMAQFGPQWLDDFWDVMYAGKQAKGKYDTTDMRLKKQKGYLDYKLSPKINQLLYGDEKKYKQREGGRIDPQTGRLKY